MKKTLTLLIAALATSLSVSCGSKSDGGGAAPDAVATTPTPAPTPTVAPDFQCEHWQVYSSQYGCLAPKRCGMYGPNYGFHDGKCVPGVRYSVIPSGEYDNGIAIVNTSKFQDLMRDMGKCRGFYSNSCVVPSNFYLFVSIYESASYNFGGIHAGVSGFSGSSFFGIQTSYGQGAGGRGINIQVNAYNNFSGNPYNNGLYLNRTALAYPTSDGFTAQLQSTFATRAVDEKLSFKFTPTDVSRNTLHAQVSYQGTVIAEGNITKN